MQGEKITVRDGVLCIPDHPIIPFIEGDGTGPDIWAAASRVFDAAVDKAYQGQKSIVWKEVYAGEKAFNKTGEWLPQGQAIMFTFQNLRKGVYRLANRNEYSRLTGKLLSNVEGLGQESFNLSGPGHDDFILISKFVHTQYGDDVLKLLVPLQNLLYPTSGEIVFLAH